MQIPFRNLPVVHHQDVATLHELAALSGWFKLNWPLKFMPTIFWGLVGPSLVLVLLIILLRRKLYHRFTVFLAYCVWIEVVAGLRFLVGKNPTSYFLVYWLTEASYFVLAFVTMLSLLHPLTQMVYRRHLWSRFLLLPVGVLVIGFSSWVALFKPITPAWDARFASGIYVFVLLMCLLEFWLFILALWVRGRLPIQWTQYEFGILSGFGVLALLTMIADVPLLFRLFHWSVGPQLENFYRYSPAGAFLGSATVWLFAFWRPEPPRATPPDLGKFHDALRVLEEQIEWVKRSSERHGLDFSDMPVRSG